jgi:transposase
MGHIEGTSRAQQMLFPEALDDSIAEENPGRFIDAFVDRVDLHALGFRRTPPAVTGRPSYAPGDFLKLYIYGYMNRLRSRRRLEKETHRNIELLWLLRKLPPDGKTIADFRKDNAKAFTQVLRAFTLLCQAWGVFGAELGAIDGRKCTALHNKQRHFPPAKLRDRRHAGEAKLAPYLRALAAAEAAETEGPPPTAAALREHIQPLRERTGRDEQLRAALEARGESQVALPDPDRRAMPTSPTVEVGDNVQTAVDAKHQRRLEHHGTKAVTDGAQRSVMAIAAKARLGGEPLQVGAERGDYHGEEIQAWEEAGIEPYVAKPLTSAKRKLGLDGQEPFPYEPASDCYRGPAGQALTVRFATVELGRQMRYYATTACRTCALTARCPRHQEGRRMTRWGHEPLLDKMPKRVEANPALMKKRKQIVEHPCGTIKDWHDHAYCLRPGLEKVRAAFRVSPLAYNLKRVMTLLGVAPMLRALPGAEKRPVPYRRAVSCGTSTPTRKLAGEE